MVDGSLGEIALERPIRKKPAKLKLKIYLKLFKIFYLSNCQSSPWSEKRPQNSK